MRESTILRSERFGGFLASPGGEALLVAVGVAAVYLAVNIAGMLLVGAFQDDGVYLVLGRAIAEGHGYRSLHLVGTPVQVKYPPGFPLLLAALWRLAPTVAGAQRIVAVLHPMMIATASGMLWWIGRVRFGTSRLPLAALVLLPVLLDASIAYYSIPLSEPGFILAWAGTVVVFERVVAGAPGRARYGWLALFGGLVAVATLFRTTGIAFVPAMIVALAMRRLSPRECGVALAAALVPLALWTLYHRQLIASGPVSTLPDESSYAAWTTYAGANPWAAASSILRNNTLDYLDGFGDYFAASPSVGWWLALLILGGTIVSAVLAIRRAPFLALSSLGATTTVIFWPVAQDRLLLPILPFLGLATIASVAPAIRRWPRRAQQVTGGLSALLLAIVLMRQLDIHGEAVSSLVDGREPRFFSPAYPLLVNTQFIGNASLWLRYNTNPADRIMVDHTAGVHLYSDRLTVPAHPTEALISASVFAVPGRYLASRILTDSVTYVLSAEDPEVFALSGRRLPGLLRDIDAVRARCPNVLQHALKGPPNVRSLYHVRIDAPCLQQLIAREPRTSDAR
jgi:hypothetical protein